MKKIRVLGIAPYEGMAELLMRSASERDDMEITVKTGDLDDGLYIAREMVQNQNFDVLISRGGTAELIRNSLDIPVIEVSISVYDILRCIKMAENYSGSFVIAGFRGITSPARILCDLLQIQASIITFSDASDVRPTLCRIKEEGCSLVICDQIGYNVSQSIGLNAIFVASGQESITDALNAAGQLMHTFSTINRQKELYKAALSGGEEAVMIFDAQARLQYSNLSDTTADSQLLRLILENRTEFLRSAGRQLVKKLGESTYHISCHPLSYGGERYSVLKVLKKSFLFEENDRTVLFYNSFSETEPGIDSDSSGSNLVGETRQMLERYADSPFPVLITGEVGTGKEKAAALLYRYSRNHNRPYYIVDCSMISQRKWMQLLTSDNSPFNDVNITIHIKNIGHMSTKELEPFYDYVKNSGLASRNRLTFSMVKPNPEAEETENYLVNRMNCLLLPLVPLRERPQDIISIATLYFNQMNLVLGKQVIGLENAAAERICRYSWPHNLDQFRRVLKEAMILTDTAYISLETVDLLLQQEDRRLAPAGAAPGTVNLDITRTLDEISQNIIRIVLAEEGINKEKAARRLGISRTTLWRALK